LFGLVLIKKYFWKSEHMKIWLAYCLPILHFPLRAFLVWGRAHYNVYRALTSLQHADEPNLIISAHAAVPVPMNF
jgi:hypothetical protein